MQVNSVALSPVPASAHTVAAACEEPTVRLGDLRIGAFTHTLAGASEPFALVKET